MESLNGRLCADPAFDGHNAGSHRGFAQRFTVSGRRALIAISRPQ
jgi:hypothetical protein